MIIVITVIVLTVTVLTVTVLTVTAFTVTALTVIVLIVIVLIVRGTHCAHCHRVREWFQCVQVRVACRLPLQMARESKPEVFCRLIYRRAG